MPIPLALIVRGCSQVWARSENHRGPCSPLCPHFKQKALLEPGSQVGGGGGAEISGLVLGCYFVLRTSGTICPCPRCPFPFPPDLPWEAKKGGSWCPPSLGLPYLSDQPLPFSFLLCVPALAVGPHACPPFGLQKEQSVHLARCGCLLGRGWHALNSFFGIKYCWKGLGQGLVQTGTNWISPCLFSKSEEARSLGRVGRRKEGRGERNVVSVSPLGVSDLSLWKGQVCPCVCVYVCSV